MFNFFKPATLERAKLKPKDAGALRIRFSDKDVKTAYSQVIGRLEQNVLDELRGAKGDDVVRCQGKLIMLEKLKGLPATLDNEIARLKNNETSWLIGS